MPQIKKVCSVTQNSQTVVVVGVDLTLSVRRNSIFMIDGLLVPYTVAQDSTFDGTNSTVILTGAYVGVTNTSASGVFVADYTYPDMIPTIAQGDVGTAAIFSKAMYRLQDLIKAVSTEGLGIYADQAAAVATGLATINSLLAQAQAINATSIATGTATTASQTAANASKIAAALSSLEAAASALAASISAAEALDRKNAAQASSTSASTSSATAAASATAVNVVLASFRQFYLGSLTTDPAVDGNGDALQEGAEYFNTVSDKLRTYSSGAWNDYDATAQAATNNANLSAAAAASSASAASTSASASAVSATGASGSASTASTQAGLATAAKTGSELAQASAQAGRVAAELAEVNAETAQVASEAARDLASSHAGTAAAQAGVATTQAGISTTQAGISTTQAGTATTQAGISATKAGEAAASAVTAGTHAATATAGAGTATTQAGISTTKAGEAATSATAANDSANEAAASAASISSGPVTSVNGQTGVVALTKANFGLSNIDNTADANKPVSTAQAAADTAVLASAATYADSLVVGLIDDRGNFDASTNVFPTTGGSGSAGAILKGDLWTVSVSGTLGGRDVTAGDLLRALVNAPGSLGANWAITGNNIGYVAENASNKNASGGYAGLTLFKLNLRNAANTITSWFTTAATVARTWTMPDKDGTVAMTSDITGVNSGTNTGDQDLSGKQATLVSGANIKTLNGSSVLGSGDLVIVGGLIATTVKTSTYTAVVNDLVRVNSAAGAFTVMLPAAPADGDKVGVFDVTGNCGTNAVLVAAAGGKTVEGDATGLSININGAFVQLLFTGTNWKTMETPLLGVFQDVLQSGTNIKQINGASILGSGNLTLPDPVALSIIFGS